MRPVARGAAVGPALVTAAVWSWALAAALPLLWIALSALKSDAEVARAPLALPNPTALEWGNFARAWNQLRFAAPALTSIVATAAAVVGSTLGGALAAYALVRFHSRLSGPLLLLLAAGLALPAQLLVVPLFFQMRALGLLDSLVGLVLVYVAQGLPFSVLVLAAFVRAVPGALFDAARVDGCGDGGVFWHVLLPLLRPGLATVAVYQAIVVWKEYLFAWLLLSGPETGGPRTLPLELADLAVTATYRADLGLLCAGVVLVVVPIAVVYAVFQRQLEAGLTRGALKE